MSLSDCQCSLLVLYIVVVKRYSIMLDKMNIVCNTIVEIFAYICVHLSIYTYLHIYATMYVSIHKRA